MACPRNSIAAIVCFLALGTVFAAAQEPEPHGEGWSYAGPNGPEHWGGLEPDYAECKLGQHQSPIDIRDAQQQSLPPIQFVYKTSPLKIMNNGHTVQITYAPGSFIVVGGKQYELRQFHFHHPSEEQIQGKPYDMVIHLVHADHEDHLAVVAVLVKQGKANPTLQKLWDHLPGANGGEESPAGVSVNAAAFLPETLGYYTFAGSLTTPPCSESVTWFVLKTPVELSAAEIAAFAKLYPHNARPIQPLNGRPVLESK
jgi:carbonic anhydrase